MTPGKRHRIERAGRVLLDLYACFLIPAYTLLFAGGKHWLDTNFSVLALLGTGQFWGFVLWGTLLAAYFLVMLTLICRTLEGCTWVVCAGTLACLCLAGAMLLPYLPEHFPKAAQAHILLAFSACVLLMLALLMILIRCCRISRKYRELIWVWAAIAAGSGILLGTVGMVSSALEIWFVITTALLIRSLWLRRTAERDIT